MVPINPFLISPFSLTGLGFSGLLGGKVIGLPPVLNFGSPEMKAKVPQVLI
jgi:hypothetical protein